MSGIGSASKIMTSSSWIALALMTFKFIKTENHVAFKNITGTQSRHKFGRVVVFSYSVKDQ